VEVEAEGMHPFGSQDPAITAEAMAAAVDMADKEDVWLLSFINTFFILNDLKIIFL
jgi:hypothetical protein